MNKQEEANLFMVKYLKKALDNDEVESDYDQKFISNAYFRVTKGMELSDKQQKYLEECFHNKY